MIRGAHWLIAVEALFLLYCRNTGRPDDRATREIWAELNGVWI